MVPSAVVVPDVSLAVFHPLGLGVLAALVVVVAVGLCVAITVQRSAAVDGSRRGQTVLRRQVAGEEEGATAA
jgi:hypothetical protein